MNYEFFFVKHQSRARLKFIRVYATSPIEAVYSAAAHFGYEGPFTDLKATRAFLNSINLHRTSILTLIPNSMRGGPKAA
jgi:hypothetical protein